MHITLGYLDAGSVSMLLSALAGGVAGAVVAVKLYFARVRDRILRRSPRVGEAEVVQSKADVPEG